MASSSDSLVTMVVGYFTAKKAEKEQLAAGKEAKDTINLYAEKARAEQQPYSEAGKKYLEKLQGLIDNGYFNMPTEEFVSAPEPTYADYKAPEFNFEADPGYAFRQQQGQQAIESSAAARGSQLSGATQKALARYGQGLASDEYGKSYGRYMQDRQQGFSEYNNLRNFLFGRYNTNRLFDYQNFQDSYNRRANEKNNEYNRIGNFVNMGVNAANNLSSLYTNQGSQLADLGIQMGNVRAGATQAKGQALNTGFSAMADPVGKDVGGLLGSILGNGGTGSFSGGEDIGGQYKMQSGSKMQGYETDYNTNPPESQDGEGGGGGGLGGIISAVIALV